MQVELPSNPTTGFSWACETELPSFKQCVQGDIAERQLRPARADAAPTPPSFLRNPKKRQLPGARFRPPGTFRAEPVRLQKRHRIVFGDFSGKRRPDSEENAGRRKNQQGRKRKKREVHDKKVDARESRASLQRKSQNLLMSQLSVFFGANFFYSYMAEC